MTSNPFAVLGLPPWPDLDDQTVQAAWRAVAAQTFPGRPDGGDPARYVQAFAAYAELRTLQGRTHACAGLAAQPRYQACPACGGLHPGGQPPEPVMVVLQPIPLREVMAMAAAIPGRIRHGHPLRLLIRAAITAAACLAVVTFLPAYGVFGVMVLATVFAACARHDLVPPVYWHGTACASSGDPVLR